MDHRWLLCDYGQVLSTAPLAGEWEALRLAAGGRPEADFHAAYWEHRPAYDRADVAAVEYWAMVTGEEPGGRLAELVRLDTAIWLHPSGPSVRAAEEAAGRGWKLAILSNAPVEVAEAIDGLGWLAPFERRFYSCNLRAVKPEPEAYLQVLRSLGTGPDRVVFFDDREINVKAAAEVGIDARLYTDAGQIRALGRP